MLKIGVQSAGWYNKNDPLGSFQYIKECGFESIDFNIDHYLNIGKLLKEGIYPSFFDQSIEEILKFFTPLKEASEATGVIIGQIVGRWGNFVNVEAYGGVTDAPWRMSAERIANRLMSNGYLESQDVYNAILNGDLGVHPTFFMNLSGI